MKGVPAVYLGNIVEKEHFRVFIYAPDGSQKLVESWDEFEEHMQIGVWFATRAEACPPAFVDEEPVLMGKAKRSKKPLKTQDEEPITEETMDCVPEDAAFEVTDDFLPQ